MANYTVNGDDLTDIADAIIAKAGLSGQLEFPDDFVDGIEGISTGTDVSDTTATAGDVRTGKYFYTSAGTKTQGTIQDQAAQTIHPSTTDQTIASGKYLTGTQTVKGVLLTNLDAGNIKKDVVVKVGDSTDDDCVTSVTGTYEGGGGGNPEAEENDVIFIDYDGTIRYSYSASEFASLTALPANPSHVGLTAQGWNWSLADAKTYVAANHILVIGQMYETDDGKTRVYIRIPYDNYSFTMYGSGTFDIDWGDGNTSSSSSPYSHTYTKAGYYVVRFSGTATSAPYLTNTTQKLLIRRMEFGGSITMPNTSSGYYCTDTIVSSYKFSSTRFNSGTAYPQYCLQVLIIPSSQSDITYFSISNFFSTKYISFPKLTSFSISSMNNLTALKMLCLPDGITSIPASCFASATAMTRATIPSSVTSIGNSAFGTSASSLQEVYVMPTTPPTLGTSVFPSNLRTIWVPSASLSAYQSASNWSSYSSKMKGI